jgi:hypothetical protein
MVICSGASPCMLHFSRPKRSRSSFCKLFFFKFSFTYRFNTIALHLLSTKLSSGILHFFYRSFFYPFPCFASPVSSIDRSPSSSIVRHDISSLSSRSRSSFIAIAIDTIVLLSHANHQLPSRSVLEQTIIGLCIIVLNDTERRLEDGCSS